MQIAMDCRNMMKTRVRDLDKMKLKFGRTGEEEVMSAEDREAHTARAKQAFMARYKFNPDEQ